jgi:CO/xanthine dehydrogenase Mo-binding subunit
VENPGNLAHQAELAWGDVDAAWELADHIVETTAHYPMLYAYAMEPYCAVASYAGGSLDVTSSTQHPFMVRNELARIFGLHLVDVTVRAPFVGGGYGSKSWTKVEPLAAVGAWKTGRPVKVALSVEEAMLTTRADSGTVVVRSAFRSSGEILARDFDIVFNTGAYADSSPSILEKAVHRCFGPYHIPNLRVSARLIYTNTVPASSYRGFGAPQTNLAGEYNIDRAAAELGIDPGELRLRNILMKGDEVLPGKRPLDADLADDLTLLREKLDDAPPHTAGFRYGHGFGCSVSDAGAFPASMALVRVLPDGSAAISTGAVEIGQGSGTVLSQIAAEELGLPLDRVKISQSDTSSTLLERTTNASRTTTIVGLAMQRACRQALDRLREMAAEQWSVSVDDIRVDAGRVMHESGKSASFTEILDGWFGTGAGEAIGIGIVRRVDETAAMPPFWEVGMSGVIVAIDETTCRVDVARLVTVGDVGFAINPAATEGQDLGAATQGLGAALFEELTYDGGQLVNPNVVDYRVPRMGDLPDEIQTVLAERADGIGPYGAKGGGEGALNPIGGAVAVAVSRALGVWSDVVRLPITPERVWHMMHGGET